MSKYPFLGKGMRRVIDSPLSTFPRAFTPGMREVDEFLRPSKRMRPRQTNENAFHASAALELFGAGSPPICDRTIETFPFMRLPAEIRVMIYE